jgi:hypothetical protein
VELSTLNLVVKKENQMKTLFILLPSILFAQEANKVPDNKIAAYFQASAAEKAAKAKHDELMDNIKKAITESITNQINTVVRALIATSELSEACRTFNMELDQTAIQNGEVKCTPKAPEKSSEKSLEKSK